MHWLGLCTALATYAFVLVIPGPNMLMVFNLSVSQSRRKAQLSGVGFGLGATLLATAAYIGVATLRSVVPDFERWMFLLSGGMLLWFGWKTSTPNLVASTDPLPESAFSGSGAVTSSCLLNLVNPKALALFVGIYGGPLARISYLEAMGFMAFCFLLEVVWYYVLSEFFGSNLVSGLSSGILIGFTKISKIILMALGLYLVLASSIFPQSITL